MTNPNYENRQEALAKLRAAADRGELTWTPAETEMSRLPRERFVRRLGVQLPEGVTVGQLAAHIRVRQQQLRVTIKTAGIPVTFDLRSVNGKNFITSIRDQGDCGSCVAFGTCAAIEGQARRGANDATLAIDVSEAQLFFCHGRAKGRNCDTGWIPHEALTACQTQGIADETCYPYQDHDQNCSGLCADWQKRAYKVTSFHEVTNDPNAIKQWLVANGPLAACFVVYDDFPHYAGGVYRKNANAKELGGHCVAIIGYDDARQCWICKNSWGQTWGENGFFNIGYGECGIESWEVCRVDGVQLPQHLDDGQWHKNTRIRGLYTVNEESNAWVYAQSAGWLRVSPDDDGVFASLLTELATAKSAGRPVDVLDRGGVISEVYVR